MERKPEGHTLLLLPFFLDNLNEELHSFLDANGHDIMTLAVSKLNLFSLPIKDFSEPLAIV